MVIRIQYIYLESPKQNLQEIIRHQAGLTKVSHAPNTAALHIVEGVKITEKDPSIQELLNGTVLTTEEKGIKNNYHLQEYVSYISPFNLIMRMCSGFANLGEVLFCINSFFIF